MFPLFPRSTVLLTLNLTVVSVNNFANKTSTEF